MKKYTLILLIVFLSLCSTGLCAEFDLPKYRVTEGITCAPGKMPVFINKVGIDLKKYGLHSVECHAMVGVDGVYFFGDRKINNQDEHVVGFMDLVSNKVYIFEKAGGKYEDMALGISQPIFFKPGKMLMPLILVLRAEDFKRLDGTSAGEFYLEVYGLKNDETIERQLQMHLGGWDHLLGSEKSRHKFYNKKGGVSRNNRYIVSPGTMSTTTGFVVDFEPKDGYLDVLLWKENFVSAETSDQKNAFIGTGEEFYVMYYDKDSKTLREPIEVKIDNSAELKNKLLWSKFAGFDYNYGFTLSE